MPCYILLFLLYIIHRKSLLSRWQTAKRSFFYEKSNGIPKTPELGRLDYYEKNGMAELEFDLPVQAIFLSFSAP